MVLGVDDDPAHRYSIGRSLEQAGFDVREATGGEEAIRLAADELRATYPNARIQLRETGSAQVLTVHNRGVPIAEDVMRRLFQPMVKGGGAAQAASNMGLGLFVCRELVQAHGGTISVTSGDEGTEFRVELPTAAG